MGRARALGENDRVNVTRPRSILLALMLFLTLLPAGAAHAHAGLASSSPAAEEELDAVPTEVTLTFTDEIAPEFTEVEVVDGEGLPVVDGEPVTDGFSVTQTLVAELHPGPYVVTYKVLSADGHPVSDAIPFTIAEGAVTADPPQATSGATPTDSGTEPAEADPTAPAEGEAPESAVAPTANDSGAASSADAAGDTPSADTPTGDATGGDDSGVTSMVLVLILCALALVTYLALMARKGRKARDGAPWSAE